MIQRIQTLFLLLSIICLGLYLYFPLIIYTLPTGTPALIENPIIYKGYALGYNMPINGIRYIVFVNLILAASAAAGVTVRLVLLGARTAASAQNPSLDMQARRRALGDQRGGSRQGPRGP